MPLQRMLQDVETIFLAGSKDTITRSPIAQVSAAIDAISSVPTEIPPFFFSHAQSVKVQMDVNPSPPPGQALKAPDDSKLVLKVEGFILNAVRTNYVCTVYVCSTVCAYLCGCSVLSPTIPTPP